MLHEFEMEHFDYHACGQPFIDMWRRVITVMRQQAAHNVGFWWSPSEGYDRDCVERSYPGDRYVDWVGTDSYNHCFLSETDCYATPYSAGWAEFGQIFDYERGVANLTTQHDRYGPSKPFVMGETGTVYDASNPSKKELGTATSSPPRNAWSIFGGSCSSMSTRRTLRRKGTIGSSTIPHPTQASTRAISKWPVTAGSTRERDFTQGSMLSTCSSARGT